MTKHVVGRVVSPLLCTAATASSGWDSGRQGSVPKLQQAPAVSHLERHEPKDSRACLQSGKKDARVQLLLSDAAVTSLPGHSNATN